MKKSFVVLLAVFGFLFFIVLIGAFFAYRSYNKIVPLDEGVTSQWAQVENVYQRRADLIPNLVNTVKGYAEFEQETLTQVIEARAKATSVNINAENLNEQNMAQFQQAQDGLGSALARLMVVVEKYPDLKANQNFLELQSQLEGTENRIANERMKFNESTQTYNTYIRKFPTTFFANIYGFEQKPYFQAAIGSDKAPEVKF